MRVYRSAVTTALFLSALAVPTLGAVSNGGFELPSSSPPAGGEWQFNGSGGGRDGTNVHAGSFAANLNNTTEGANTNVQQQTPFGSVSAGTNYTLSFWAQGQYGVGGIGQAQVAFMNSGGGILAGYPQFINIPASANYQLFSQSYTAPAGSSAFFIAFNAVTGAVTGSTSHLYIDDVALGSVPEPTSLAALGLGAVALRRRRKF